VLLDKRMRAKIGFLAKHRRKPSREELDLLLGKRARQQLAETRFIGITGSAGKSTCGALLQHLLGHHFRVAASLLENTPRVLARRILELSKQDQFAVMEMSGHMSGVLTTSCDLVQPEMGIVISISNDHYSNFRGVEKTIEEKVTLVRRTAATGCVFLNADDPAVLSMAEAAQARVLTFGCHPMADYRARDVGLDVAGWLQFNCIYKDQTVPFRLPLPALHFLPSVLAAIACAHQTGLSLISLAQHAERFKPLPGRCSLHQLQSGQTVICDTVKAPMSTLSLAFATLDGFQRSRPRRIILGNVSDYPGSWGPKMRRLAEEALGFADQLIFFRPLTKVDPLIARYGSDRIVAFERIDEIAAFLREHGTPDDVLLLKSSARNHLEALLLPLIGQPSCSREPCGLSHSCFNCEYGFARQRQHEFDYYKAYCTGIVRKLT